MSGRVALRGADSQGMPAMNTASIVYIVLIWVVFMVGSYLAIHTAVVSGRRPTRSNRADRHAAKAASRRYRATR